MNRRDLLASVAFGGLVGGHRFSFAQTRKERPLIVWFASATQAMASPYIGFLQEGLRELGDIEGREFEFAGRFADFKVEQLPGLAEEIVRLNPAIIVCGAVDTATAARKATAVIPIVSAALADAVHLGLVASYPRPGGNVTGITPYIEGLPAKQLEIVREIVPRVKRIGLLGNVNDPKAPPQRKELEAAAETAGIEVVMPDLAAPGDIEAAVTALAVGPVEAVIVLQTTMMLGQRRNIARLMATHRVPAVYGYREHIDEGGLISYGVDLRWCWHHLAMFVHKILNGATPADLPIEFPPRVQLVINMKTAKALGLTVPSTLLARADEVIE
jgi:putative ABC transport system substrate-binding protein